MDALIGLELTGKLVESDNVWMVVFPDAGELRKLLREVVESEFGESFGQDYKVVEPLSWSAFPELRKNNGLHITLSEKPKNTSQNVVVTVTGHALFKEKARWSNLGGWTKGFVVLLVDTPKTLKCSDGPCHISVGQSLKKTDDELKHDQTLKTLGLK